ncbi:AmmeMemoRadiSam system protein B [Candidatus Woesearchaeota archaeon]|nr:AmmeMemoRadiSam system protein B [Candidatus Woesearchaeota archaeon]
MSVRKPAVAGMFYPEDDEELKYTVEGLLSRVPITKIDGRIRAIIVPHAGYVYSGEVAAYAYKLVSISQVRWNKAIIIGPAHTAYMTSPVVDGSHSWETPIGIVDIDDNTAANFEEMSDAHTEEHCLEVQLPFLQTVLDKGFKIIPLVVGDANPKEVSDALEKALDDDTLLVISSDLSHFHDDETCRELDGKTVDAISSLDASSVGEACGAIPIMAAISIAKKKGWKIKKLCYKNSSEVSGEMNRVVGYASFVIYE